MKYAQRFSGTKWLLGLIGVLIVGFLVIGSFNRPDSPALITSLLTTDSFPMLALLSFAGGLFSFLSPCTLPILPAYFSFAFRGGRTTIAANTIAFMLGLSLMFSFLGAGASAVGGLFVQNQPLLLLLGGSLIIVMGMMSILGQGFSGASNMTQTAHSRTVGGSFLFGSTFALGWSSCIGPILGIVLSLAATSGSILNGMMLLFIYAMGLGLPLMLVSMFMGRLPKSHILWRSLRGKGWMVNAPSWIPAAIWGLGAWMIARPLIRYFIPAWQIDANPFVDKILTLGPLYIPFSYSWTEVGLLVGLIGAAVLISFAITSGLKTTTMTLHSTQLITGILFLLMGVLLINNQLFVFAGLAELPFAETLMEWEQLFLERFMK